MIFKNKVAIVTGAASGIGAATTRLLASRGARVLAADRDASGLASIATEIGDAVVAHAIDVADPVAIEAMVSHTVDLFGRLDILVNNAGVGSFGRASDLDPDEWRRVMNVNLDPVFRASRVALPHLITTRGAIVNTASISGIAADYGVTAYGAAKAAVIALTRSMGIDYAQHGVRVNSVSPGLIDTPIVAAMMDDMRADYASRVPARRVGRPEEIAEVVAFLASDMASYVIAQNIVADGGLTATTGAPDAVAYVNRLMGLAQ